MPLLTVADLDARTVAESVILAGIKTELSAFMVMKDGPPNTRANFSPDPSVVGAAMYLPGGDEDTITPIRDLLQMRIYFDLFCGGSSVDYGVRQKRGLALKDFICEKINTQTIRTVVGNGNVNTVAFDGYNVHGDSQTGDLLMDGRLSIIITYRVNPTSR